MKLHMFGMGCAGQKIFGGIVSPIKIYVVNFFARDKGSPKRPFRDDNVLKNIALFIRSRMFRKKQFLVALFQNKRLFPVVSGASHAAKLCARMLIEIRASAVRAWRRLARLPSWARIVLLDVVSSTQAATKVFFVAFRQGASPKGPAFFSLLCHWPSALPRGITSHIAEMALRSGVRIFDCLGAIGTYHTFHKQSVLALAGAARSFDHSR